MLRNHEYTEQPPATHVNFVLERRVNQPSYEVGKALRDRATIAPVPGFALGRGATLVIEDPPRRATHPVIPGYESWRTTARLLNNRRRLVARVDIEIGTWSPGSMIMQVRPIDRSPHRWGARRTRRYFALAHAGADRLEQLLNNAGAPTAPTREVPFTIRPIEPEDSDALRALFWRLSPESRYYRFLSPVTRPEENVLHHLAEVDHGARDALVAVVDDQVVGVARYDRDASDPNAAEVAIVVEDAWHRHGIATALIHDLSKLAFARGIEHFTATVAADNRAVSTFVRSLPVHATWNWDHGQRQLGVELAGRPVAG